MSHELARSGRKRIALSLAGGLAILVAACGGGGASQAPASDGGTDVLSFHMRMTPSNVAWAIAQDEGLFDRVEIDWELVGYGESAQLFVAGQDPVGQESPWEAARFQAEGDDIVYFGTPGALNFYTGIIVRTADAAKYKTLDDLKGQKLGTPGFGTGTWAAFEVISKVDFGLDARNDFQVIEADPGALLGLLETGEIEGMMTFTGQTVQALTSPDYTMIYNFSEEWQAGHGAPLVINGPMARREWLLENEAGARRLIEGVDKGLQWAKDNPDELKEGGKYGEIVAGEGWHNSPETFDAIFKLLQEDKWYFTKDLYTNAWIDSVYDFITKGEGILTDAAIPTKDKVFYLPFAEG